MAAEPKSDETREFWERAFGRAEQAGPEQIGRDLSEVVALLRSHGAVSVLDVGCGLGHWSLTLAGAGFQVTALDISSRAVAITQRRGREEGLTISGWVSAVQEIELRETLFDAVICNSVLDHLPLGEAAAGVRNLQGLVHSGGLLYLSFDGPEDLPEDGRAQIAVQEDGTWRYVQGERRGMIWRHYTDDEIRAMCSALEELTFQVGPQGRREVWLRAPASGPARLEPRRQSPTDPSETRKAT